MDRSELRACMARKGISARTIAKEMGISETAYYNKINGHSEFKESEIRVLVRILDLSAEKINQIFLSHTVN